MMIRAKQSLSGKTNVGNVIYGKDGATFTPNVDDEGNLSWTNNGELENPEVVNLKGPEGRTPVKGVDYYTQAEQQTLAADIMQMLKSTMKAAKIGVATLLASAWVGENNLYSQVVDIEGVTEHSQVDLTPDVHQLAIFYEKDLTFVTENEDGVVTVYVIGQKPTNDYAIQVTITEVDV
jgi:hypothetical protein